MRKDDGDAFARFQRNQSTFKEKNKVEITLDTRYDVSQPEESAEKAKEKEDEQGWTQSQQKALELWENGGVWSVER